MIMSVVFCNCFIIIIDVVLRFGCLVCYCVSVCLV